MQTTLVLTTFFMGLAGGPHCIAMCGTACAGISNSRPLPMTQFHAGRLLGYATLGAVAAASIQGLGWLTTQTAALHPLWTFFHVLVLCWGLILITYARQPLWVTGMGRSIWLHVRQLSNLPGGKFMTGLLWALMPCGLLYSALLVASLSANMLSGAMSMATFAVGTSISLIVGPWLWIKLKHGQWVSEESSMRLAGLLLTIVAAWAVWMDIMHQQKIWCS
ncbi:MAG: sulfite exporter TauE/SafE family protein [Methylophilales bacterium]|nr:sulfite exporter TauE/SafE family protein [Methylophilales bacterium]